MRASWIVMLMIGALACAGLSLMMNHMKGILSSESVGFDTLTLALKSESVSPSALVIENHDGLRTLRISVDLRRGTDAKVQARHIGDLAWEKIGSIQSLDHVVVDWTGQGGGSLDVGRETSLGRRRGVSALAPDSRTYSRLQTRPATRPVTTR